jgi:hypothetical protein
MDTVLGVVVVVGIVGVIFGPSFWLMARPYEGPGCERKKSEHRVARAVWRLLVRPVRRYWTWVTEPMENYMPIAQPRVVTGVIIPTLQLDETTHATPDEKLDEAVSDESQTVSPTPQTVSSVSQIMAERGVSRATAYRILARGRQGQ